MRLWVYGCAAKRRLFTWVSIVLSLVCFAACMGGEVHTPVTSAGENEAPYAPAAPLSTAPSVPQAIQHRLRFSTVGDNLIHSAIFESARVDAEETAGESAFDFAFCYEHIRPHLENFDVNWINQETLINNEIPPSNYPCFSTPGALGFAAFQAGFNVFSLANNHSYDYLVPGVEATLRWWQTAQASAPDVIAYGLFTGREDDSGIALQQKNGFTIAYVAFTFGTNGITIPADSEHYVIYTSETTAMEHKVRRAREMADVVVVSAHWGTENSHIIHNSQRTLGQQFADWGADVVIGTHPHVIQDLEWVQSADGRQVLVMYSLGNFLSAQAEANQLVGLMVDFELVQTEYPDGTRGPLQIEAVRARPVVTQYERPVSEYYDHPRTYLFCDYTDELAAQHHVRSKNGAWGRSYIQSLCQEQVSPAFLALE